jgi:hypothetical protein
LWCWGLWFMPLSTGLAEKCGIARELRICNLSGN